MAGTSNTSTFLLLADEYRLFLQRAGGSEKYANKLVQRFLEEGECDRDGRIRYKIWLVEAVPGGGAPSPYDGRFWCSDPERGISCVIEAWHSSACWTGPTSAAWKAVHGREVSSYQVTGIRLNHEVVLEFLESAGLSAKPAQPGESGEPGELSTAGLPREQPAPEPGPSIAKKPPTIKRELADAFASFGRALTSADFDVLAKDFGLKSKTIQNRYYEWKADK
jgi:hypothetical protein